MREGGLEEEIIVPLSGHVAGVWARVDDTRGVHRAPADESLRGVTAADTSVTRDEQECLTTPASTQSAISPAAVRGSGQRER